MRMVSKELPVFTPFPGGADFAALLIETNLFILKFRIMVSPKKTASQIPDEEIDPRDEFIDYEDVSEEKREEEVQQAEDEDLEENDFAGAVRDSIEDAPEPEDEDEEEDDEDEEDELEDELEDEEEEEEDDELNEKEK